ncbi:Uncharacterised protein [Klebsiella pneumoniae]|nr:Uncharacterised protein [Klebsiella pneumoniae]
MGDDGIGPCVGIHPPHEILAMRFARQGDLRSQQLVEIVAASQCIEHAMRGRPEQQ